MHIILTYVRYTFTHFGAHTKASFHNNNQKQSRKLKLTEFCMHFNAEEYCRFHRKYINIKLILHFIVSNFRVLLHLCLPNFPLSKVLTHSHSRSPTILILYVFNGNYNFWWFSLLCSAFSFIFWMNGNKHYSNLQINYNRFSDRNERRAQKDF